MRAWVLAALMATASVQAQEPVKLFAAGSLRAAMTELADAFGPGRVVGTFGPSGLLRDRIVGGEPAEVFASANMTHPESLAKAGRAGPVSRFARNELCALARPGLALEPRTVLDRLLDPAIALGTSTPKADPSGDYAWDLFRKADQTRPGAYAILDRKARKLTGGADSPPAPKDRSVYGMLVSEGKADVFLTYCTNALAARKENPALQMIGLPPELAVGAEYGVVVLTGASRGAKDFADFVLSAKGQDILARHGFGKGQ